MAGIDDQTLNEFSYVDINDNPLFAVKLPSSTEWKAITLNGIAEYLRSKILKSGLISEFADFAQASSLSITTNCLNPTNGLTTTDGNHHAFQSSFVSIDANMILFVKGYEVICFYTLSYAFISSVGANGGNINGRVQTPSNAVYMKFTHYMGASTVNNLTIKDMYIVRGYSTVAENLEDLGVTTDKIADGSISTMKIASNAVTPEKTLFFEASINKFNYLDSDILRGYYIGLLGVIRENTSYSVTGFIPITVGQILTCNLAQLSAGAYHWMYDANKTLIAGSGVNMVKTVTGVTGCAYVRFTLNLNATADISTANIQVELGATSTSYIPYGSRINAAKYLQLLSIQNSHLADKSVAPEKTLFFEASLNKFNYLDSDILRGKYISSTGSLQTNTAYSVSGFIPIVAGQTLICNKLTAGGAIYNAQYNASKVLIAGTVVNTATAIGATGCAYVRFTLNLSDVADISTANIQVEVGTTSTSYIPYGNVIYAEKNLAYYSIISKLLADNAVEARNLAIDSVLSKNILDKNITLKKLSFMQPSSNLFNYDDADILRGKYLSSIGALQTNNLYTITGFIPITVGKILTCNLAQTSSGTYHWQYDANKTLIAGSGVNMTKTVTGITGCAYVRFSLNLSATADIVNALVQVEQGTVSTPFKPYLYFPRQLIETNTLLLFLPSEICIATGRTIEIYNSQVAWCGNRNDYHFFWSGVGRCMKKKWTCTGTEGNIGSYSLTLQVFDKNNLLVAQATTTVNIVSNVIVNSFSVGPFGDSLTNQKAWETELISLSANKISLVGSRWGNATGIGDTYRHEGRSGVTPAWYLANSSYTFDSRGNNGADRRSQSLNPLWNPNTGTVDFGYYKSNYNVNPDKLMIWLGTNGISTDPTAAVGQIKSLIDAIRSNSSTIPIFVVFTLFRADQNGIGIQTGVDGYTASSTYKLVEDYKVFVLQAALYAALSAYSNLYFVPVSLCHDSENNFGADVVPVNPRASQTETIPYEATHPQNQGYMQIADIIFSAIAAHQ